MKKLLLLATVYFLSCSPGNHLKKFYTAEDKTVFDLVEKLQKNAADKESLDLLPQAYTIALDKRKQLSEANFNTLPPGDRYQQLAKEFGVMQQMYEKINAVPAAKKIVTNLWDPSVQILSANNNAAKEYYNQGLEYMNYDNRQSARSAYDYFSKANKLVPGYQDVKNLMQEASERATIKVVVQNVRYYNQNYNYWGYQNDWLQQQIITDLNNQSFRDVRFYSEWDANSYRIRADRLVNLNFTELYVGQFFNKRFNINRSKDVQIGTTKDVPGKPIYQTIYATVNVTQRYMQSRATLECRIYDEVTGNNLLYDRFPSNDDWKVETATYTGDKDALTQEDWNKINNRGSLQMPTRNEVADRLIRRSYNLLLSRIKAGVQFGS